MNFLSHFYFDNKLDKHYYNFGLILPDLSKNYLKFKIDENMVFEKTAFEIHTGVCQHIIRDKYFHSSPYFINECKRINDYIKSEKYNHYIDKYWFWTHIIIELKIDYVLINNIDNLYENFLFCLNSIDLNEINTYLNHYNSIHNDSIIKNINNFQKSNFISKYKTINGVIENIYQFSKKINLEIKRSKKTDQILEKIINNVDVLDINNLNINVNN